MQHPKRLGKYDIVEVLGEGAMGVVYKGHDPGIDRPVAIKTIRKSLLEGENRTVLPARFRNEAKAVGRMSHPGIVSIYEYGEDDTTAFIAMEFVQGRDLAQILAATPLLPEPTIVRFMQQLLDALACAHRHGVWHRDIKPANLIVTKDGRLKVTDFGIARIESAALTQMAATIGTPGYMSPEQYMGEEIDHRIDIFAAGVVLYRMLCGKAPFVADSAEGLMYKVLHKDPEPLSHMPGKNISAAYDPIIAMALAKDPNARYASALEFRSALSDRSAQHEGTSDDDATIIAALPLLRQRAQAAAALAAGGSASDPDATLPYWNPASLAPVEAALTRFMGPLAKVLVRQAAKVSSDLRSLQDTLCQHIPDPQDRARFMTLVNGAGTGSTGGGLATPSTAGGTGGTGATGGTVGSTVGAQPISPELVEHARLALTRHLGPIAKVVLKKAVAQAHSPEHLIELLAQQVDDPGTRVKLLEALRRKPA